MRKTLERPIEGCVVAHASKLDGKVSRSVEDSVGRDALRALPTAAAVGSVVKSEDVGEELRPQQVGNGEDSGDDVGRDLHEHWGKFVKRLRQINPSSEAPSLTTRPRRNSV